jgi:hypothetical protein
MITTTQRPLRSKKHEGQGIGKKNMQQMQDCSTQRRRSRHLRKQTAQTKTRLMVDF